VISEVAEVEMETSEERAWKSQRQSWRPQGGTRRLIMMEEEASESNNNVILEVIF